MRSNLFMTLPMNLQKLIIRSSPALRRHSPSHRRSLLLIATTPRYASFSFSSCPSCASSISCDFSIQALLCLRLALRRSVYRVPQKG